MPDNVADYTGPWVLGGSTFPGSQAMLDSAAWLRTQLGKLGIAVPPSSRLERAERLIGEVQANRIVPTLDDTELLERLTDANRTITEFYIIVRAIIERPKSFNPTVRDKLVLMFGGHELESADRNNLARNTQFELFVYATFLMGGASVRIAEPDLQFLYGGGEVGLAAKRLRSPTQLERRAEEAADQIEATGNFGFIAVNLDRFAVGLPQDTDISVEERGAAYNENIRALHHLFPKFAGRPKVLGIMNFGTATTWHLRGDKPRFHVGTFRQMLVFADTPAEQEQGKLFWDGLLARVGNAIDRL